MTRSGLRTRALAAGFVAITMTLAAGGVVSADIGLAGFSPTSDAPGDTVTVVANDAGPADRAHGRGRAGR